MRTVRMSTVIGLALFFVVGDALASALITGSWLATAARASGITAYVFILFIASNRKTAS